jgi:hypothetical protein
MVEGTIKCKDCGDSFESSTSLEIKVQKCSKCIEKSQDEMLKFMFGEQETLSNSSASVNDLALAISSCKEVCKAFKNNNHPCSSVVSWQANQWTEKFVQIEGSRMHRPEAWTGNLATAPIIFLASNPSFDATEHFPSWNRSLWSDEKIIDFAVNRFTTSLDRSYGATQSNLLDLQDRTVGIDGSLSDKVDYWVWVRKYVALILNKKIEKTSSIEDYVMTELVHCKSANEEGVTQALHTCGENWFEQIMSKSPAKLLFVAGVKAGEAFAQIYHEELPETWGCWTNSKVGKGKGFWPKSKSSLTSALDRGQWKLEHQLKNTVEIQIGGRKRLVIYVARPNRGASIYAPWAHPDLLSSDYIGYLRNYLNK